MWCMEKKSMNYTDKTFNYCKLNVKGERSKEDIGPTFLWNLLWYWIYGQNKPRAIPPYQYLMVGADTSVSNARLIPLTLNYTLPLVSASQHSALTVGCQQY